jgi:hypothetical protein
MLEQRDLFEGAFKSWYNLKSWFILLIFNCVQHFFCFLPFCFQFILCLIVNVFFSRCLEVGWTM